MRRLAPLKTAIVQPGPAVWCVRVLAGIALLAASSAVWAQPFGYSVNSRGNFSDSNDVNALWRINLTTGAEERVSDQGLPTGYLDLEALAINNDDQLFGVDDDSKTLVRVSMVTGVASAIGGTTSNLGLPLGTSLDFGMAFACDNEAYVVSDVEQSLFTANTTTGALTRVGAAGSLSAPITDIAIQGYDAYGIGVGLDSDGNTAAPNLYRVDLVRGTSTLIGPLGPDAGPYNNAGLSFDKQGQLWAITDRRQVGGQDMASQILKIDTATGEASLIGMSIVGLESLAIESRNFCPQSSPVNIKGVPVPTLNAWAVGFLVLVLMCMGVARTKRGKLS